MAKKRIRHRPPQNPGGWCEEERRGKEGGGRCVGRRRAGRPAASGRLARSCSLSHSVSSAQGRLGPGAAPHSAHRAGKWRPERQLRLKALQCGWRTTRAAGRAMARRQLLAALPVSPRPAAALVVAAAGRAWPLLLLARVPLSATEASSLFTASLAAAPRRSTRCCAPGRVHSDRRNALHKCRAERPISPEPNGIAALLSPHLYAKGRRKKKSRTNAYATPLSILRECQPERPNSARTELHRKANRKGSSPKTRLLALHRDQSPMAKEAFTLCLQPITGDIRKQPRFTPTPSWDPMTSLSPRVVAKAEPMGQTDVPRFTGTDLEVK